MRIWAFPSFYPFDAPGEKWKGIFAHRQYKGLIEKGAELSVVLPVSWRPPAPLAGITAKWQHKGPEYPKRRVYDGIQVYHPRIANMLPYALDKRSHKEKFADAVAGLFKELNIKVDPATDIFFSQWLPESVNVQYAAHKLGLKSAILSIGDDVVVWPYENNGVMAAFKELQLGADMRFACADYLGRETNKIVGQKLAYDVVNWGVDHDFFKPVSASEKADLRKKYQLPQDKLLILNVGTAIARKGWLDLFDALAQIKGKTPDFVLVGVHSGPPEFDLDTEAAKRGLKDNFRNLGEVPPQQVREVYNAVDIFCLPSHWEGLANANIEAMSSGLPVITTDVCGHPELIETGVNGILVPPKDVPRLADALQLLLTNDEQRRSLSEAGRSFIVNRWGNFAHNASLLYSKLSGKE
jgi:glycosyltransferase involved in cell wall biosynthesis